MNQGPDGHVVDVSSDRPWVLWHSPKGSFAVNARESELENYKFKFWPHFWGTNELRQQPLSTTTTSRWPWDILATENVIQSAAESIQTHKTDWAINSLDPGVKILKSQSLEMFVTVTLFFFYKSNWWWISNWVKSLCIKLFEKRVNLDHIIMEDLDAILQMQFSVLFYWLVSPDLLMINALRWMPQDLIGQVMVWCRQCWARPLSPNASLGHDELISCQPRPSAGSVHVLTNVISVFLKSESQSIQCKLNTKILSYQHMDCHSHRWWLVSTMRIPILVRGEVYNEAFPMSYWVIYHLTKTSRLQSTRPKPEPMLTYWHLQLEL